MVVKGKKLTLKEHWQKLKQELKGMTLKEKLEHLWEYYKWVLGVAIGVVFVIGVIIASIISLNQELRLAGAIINVDVSPDGYVMLQDGYFERIGGQEGKEVVELRNMQFRDPYTTTDQTYALDVYESVMSMVAAQVLDYIMFDDLALSFFLDPELLLDLRELVSQEELADMGSAVIWVQVADSGERIPLAINIRDTAFFQTQMESDKDIYLAFAVTTPRREACLDFWHYIKGGQTDTLQTVLAGTVLDAQLDESSEKLLTQGVFERLGCIQGDHRVELTQQSLAEAEEEILAHLKDGLESGTLDYVLCSGDALAALADVKLMDLSDILPQQTLTGQEDALTYRNGVPVAVELSALGITKTETWLVFGAGTKRAEACKALWTLLTDAQ